MLKNKVPVLYSGTGCQIAGLQSYLGKEFNCLYTVEVACHGVPSPGLFIRYIDWLENKYNTKIANYTFRNKVKHKKGEHYTFVFEDIIGRKFYRYSNQDPFYAAFLKGKTLRDTCYHCKYKGTGHVVLVHGDTSTTFVTALACFYLQIPVGHVEAGLRTYNIYSPYPEEFNRQAVSIISKFNFAPTELSKQNLLKEGKKQESIYVTGNTAIDALKTTVRENYTHPETYIRGYKGILEQ